MRRLVPWPALALALSVLLGALLWGCASQGTGCGTRLRPINSAPIDPVPAAAVVTMHSGVSP